jgi:hypothetical protein
VLQEQYRTTTDILVCSLTGWSPVCTSCGNGLWIVSGWRRNVTATQLHKQKPGSFPGNLWVYTTTPDPCCQLSKLKRDKPLFLLANSRLVEVGSCLCMRYTLDTSAQLWRLRQGLARVFMGDVKHRGGVVSALISAKFRNN